MSGLWSVNLLSNEYMMMVIIIIIINEKISVAFSPKTARTLNTQKKTTCLVDRERNKRVSSTISTID